MAFTLTGTRQPREAWEGLTLWSYMTAARLYEAEPAFSRGGDLSARLYYFYNIVKHNKYHEQHKYPKSYQMYHAL